MRATGEMVAREIAGENILIPVGKTALRLHGMINVSESGRMIWDRLKEECTESDLVDMLLAEYDVDRETAQKDVAEFLDRMRELEILEE